MIIVLLLACIAILLSYVGRYLILREDVSLQGVARRAMAVLPGAELIYLIIRWERARTGSAVCALAIVLALPFFGQIMVIAKDSDEFSTSRKSLIATLETTIHQERLKSQKSQRKVDELETIKAKEAKLSALQQYTVDWYALLREREGYLCSEIPDEIEIFNRSAAAYHSLLAVAGRESVELDQFKNRTASQAH